MFFTYLFIFVFGSIIGSFLNVVVLRYNTGRSVSGRSGCMSCGKKLSWYELIPILSFLLQKGKCRGCKTKVSWQYPVVEMMTGILFLLTFLHSSLAKALATSQFFNYQDFFGLIYLWIIFSILISITVYDLKHKIIPDGMVFLFSIISLLPIFLNIYHGVEWTTLLSGPALAAPLALLWLVSKGEWIGLGDAKLALGMGWFLGLVDGISAVVLAFWIGSLFGISLIIFSRVYPLFFGNKNFTIKSEIPFAPFLILGLVIIFFTGWDVLGLKMFLSF